MVEFLPSEFYLGQNYPNPFWRKTTIKYCVAYKTRVKLTVYDLDGKVIEKLVDEEKYPGTYEVEFYNCHSCLSLPDGKTERNPDDEAYIYRLETGEYKSEKKMVMHKQFIKE